MGWLSTVSRRFPLKPLESQQITVVSGNKTLGNRPRTSRRANTFWKRSSATWRVRRSKKQPRPLPRPSYRSSRRRTRNRHSPERAASPRRPAGKKKLKTLQMRQSSKSRLVFFRRPQRTSKQKALNQVKQWCGNISDRDDDLLLKRPGSSSSEDERDDKRMKLELDSGSEEEWTGEAPEPERTGLPGRPRILSKSANTVNGVAKKMTANEVAKSIGKLRKESLFIFR